MKDGKSRIDDKFSTKLLKKILKLNESDKELLIKFQKIEETLVDAGFKVIGRGTNRIVVVKKNKNQHVFKVAIDYDGRIANANSFRNGVLNKHFATSVEIDENHIVVVQKRYDVMTKNQFKDYRDEILDILKELKKNYVLFDVGYTNRCYKNWALTPNGRAICIDHGYVEPITKETDFRCRSIVMKDQKQEKMVQCKGKLRYNKNFTKLYCDECGAEFEANVIFRPRLDVIDAMEKANGFEDGFSSDEYEQLAQRSREVQAEREKEFEKIRNQERNEFIDNYYKNQEGEVNAMPEVRGSARRARRRGLDNSPEGTTNPMVETPIQTAERLMSEYDAQDDGDDIFVGEPDADMKEPIYPFPQTEEDYYEDNSEFTEGDPNDLGINYSEDEDLEPLRQPAVIDSMPSNIPTNSVEYDNNPVSDGDLEAFSRDMEEVFHKVIGTPIDVLNEKMELVNESINSIYTMINSLTKRSEELTKIQSVLDQYTKQTNTVNELLDNLKVHTEVLDVPCGKIVQLDETQMELTINNGVELVYVAFESIDDCVAIDVSTLMKAVKQIQDAEMVHLSSAEFSPIENNIIKFDESCSIYSDEFSLYADGEDVDDSDPNDPIEDGSGGKPAVTVSDNENEKVNGNNK